MVATTDPFLDAYSLGGCEGVFSIGGFERSIALTDQMVRAAMLMERLHQLDLLGRKTRVCVVGAGFGGATAAVRAGEDRRLSSRGS